MPETAVAQSVELGHLAQRPFAEQFATEPKEAIYIAKNGERSRGVVTVRVTPASIAASFEDREAFAIPEERYGEPGGRLEAVDGSWESRGVTYVTTSTSGARLFDCPHLVVRHGAERAAHAARVVLAGVAWSGITRFGAAAAVLHDLTPEATSHHDRRIAVAVAREMTGADVEALERLCGFIGGIAVPALLVERYDADGTLVGEEHLRGYRRVGRFPHSPFPARDDVRVRAFTVLGDGFAALREQRFPIDIVLDQIAASNVVSQIHVSAQLLTLAVQTIAYRISGASRASAHDHAALYAALGERLRPAGLDETSLSRLVDVRDELLESGFFGPPDYSTGRPQRDIKFVRDVTHTSIFRLGGYTGPYWSSEAFAVGEFV